MDSKTLSWRIGAVVAALIISAFVNWRLKRSHGIEGKKYPIDALDERLQCYADLSGLNDSKQESASANTNPLAEHHDDLTNNTKEVPDDALLSVGQHKILLGILKKIEAKNGVLGAVNFALLAVLAGYLNANQGHLQEPSILCAAFTVTLLTISVLLRIEGNSHLGQRRYKNIVGEGKSLLDQKKQMQEDLKVNLIQKEVSFLYSIVILLIALFVILLPVGYGYLTTPAYCENAVAADPLCARVDSAQSLLESTGTSRPAY